MLHMLYGDLSGKTILTSGSYLGLEGQWLDAINAWISARAKANVEEFHATDFFNAQGAFDDDRWRRLADDGRTIPGGPLHDEFAELFTNIPRRAGLIGFAYSVDVPSFKTFLLPEIRKERRKHRAISERTYAIMNNVARVSKFLTDAGYQEQGRIQIMFEEEVGSTKYTDFFLESRDRQEQWTYFFQSFHMGPKGFPPIEMADLAAHEGWRRTKEEWSKTPRKLRKSFEAMIGEGFFELQTHGPRAAELNAGRMRDIHSMFPNGLIPADYGLKP